MSLALLVIDRDGAEPVVGPAAVERLADLGVTRVSLLGDALSVGVIVEGWALDPARIDDVAAIVIPSDPSLVRVFHEIGLVALAPSPEGSQEVTT